MSEKNNPSQLDTIIIFTSRLQELASFYQQAFEIGPFETLPNHLGCQIDSVYLGFDQVDDQDVSHGGVSLWFTVDDIQHTFDRLIELGARKRYLPTKKEWGGFVASVYDLDGNILGISQR